MPALFGTDGIRGVANRDVTPGLAFSLGRAAVEALGAGERPRIAIGRDTRVSGPMLQAALSAGVCSAGGDVVRLGVVPTPAVSFLTPLLGAAAGVVISASHNPPEDNGIKFFSGEGVKLADDVEGRIEELVMGADEGARPKGAAVGNIEDVPDAAERYLAHLLEAADGTLEGMHLVVDCCHGAAYRLGPEALRRLGARVDVLHGEPEGMRINVGSGATHPDVVAAAVVERGADAGVAFDGDADRALFAAADGSIIDGDQVIVACALALQASGRLEGGRVVVTVMSNLGLRRALEEAGIEVVETRVGDRYVMEAMQETGASLGGEQSGHIVFREHAGTGDGILTAVRFLSLASGSGAAVAELAASMRRFPQVLENVRVPDARSAAAAPAVEEAVRRATDALGSSGRVLVRASGTEPLVRVMVEAEGEEEARRHAAEVARVVASS